MIKVGFETDQAGDTLGVVVDNRLLQARQASLASWAFGRQLGQTTRP